MAARPLVVITTRLPPQTCGIGTYSWLLHKHWPDRSAAVEFLVMEGAAGADPLRERDRVTAFNGNAAALARELERIGAADVLLHYAGRAYQRLGCPWWMPGVLARWKSKFTGARLLIVFHEIPGEFPITSLHFWLGKLSSHIIRRLASIADLTVTNTAHHAAKLRQISGRQEIHLLPVASNIETAPETSEPRLRTEFLVFGLPFGRWQTLQTFASHLRQWHAEGRLTKLHLVGPHDDEFSLRAEEVTRAWGDRTAIVQHGTLPSPEVAALLRRVRFALTNVSETTWSKSSAFMAAAANECSVVIHSTPPESVPLCHAVGAAEVNAIADAELARRSEALADWYRANADWPVLASRIAALLDQELP
ncbi:MAG: hypothetical protein ABR589_08415 [Chthoniobacterales bacterium]